MAQPRQLAYNFCADGFGDVLRAVVAGDEPLTVLVGVGQCVCTGPAPHEPLCEVTFNRFPLALTGNDLRAAIAQVRGVRPISAEEAERVLAHDPSAACVLLQAGLLDGLEDRVCHELATSRKPPAAALVLAGVHAGTASLPPAVDNGTAAELTCIQWHRNWLKGWCDSHLCLLPERVCLRVRHMRCAAWCLTRRGGRRPPLSEDLAHRIVCLSFTPSTGQRPPSAAAG